MRIVQKLTFLLIIFALFMPVTVVKAANMPDCPMSGMTGDVMMGADMDNMPCHGDDMSQNTDQNCADMCKTQCLSFIVLSILPQYKSKIYIPRVEHTFLTDYQGYVSLPLDVLYHPPIIIS
jgi:hypothetical protein